MLVCANRRSANSERNSSRRQWKSVNEFLSRNLRKLRSPPIINQLRVSVSPNEFVFSYTTNVCCRTSEMYVYYSDP